MKILVTGAAGFIGAALCERLLKDGHEVFGIDTLLNNNSSRIKLFDKYGNKFHFINYDVIDYVGSDIDIIYNFASPTIPSEFKKYPIQTLTTNTHGVVSLLDHCREFNIKMIHASTIRVLEPIKLTSPNACYIEGKRCAEVFCYEFAKLGVDVNVVRLYSVYGPGMKKDDTRVIPTFIRKALNNEDIELVGDGSQLDTFTYIDNAVNLFSNALTKPLGLLTTFDCGDTCSILDLANLIKELTGSKSKIIKTNKEFEGINRIGRQCWHTKVSLRKGLERMIEKFKE